MAVRPRGRKWEADVRFDGNRIRYSFPTYDEAAQWEAQANLDMLNGKRPGPPREGKSKVMTLKATLDWLLKTEPPAGWKGAKSLRHLVHNANEVIDHFGENRLARTIHYEEVDGFISGLRDRKKNGGGTINRKLAALSKMLHAARRFDPSMSIPNMPRQREGRPRERVLSPEETEKLVNWDGWQGHEALLTTFLVDTGCRLSEAFGVEPRDLRDGNVTFRDTKNPNGDYRERTIPLTERLRKALAFAQQRDRVFEVNAHTYRHRYNEAVAALDLGPGVVIHTLRHTLASRFGRAGVNGFQLMRWFGWSSPATASRYVKIDTAALNAMMELIAA